MSSMVLAIPNSLTLQGKLTDLSGLSQEGAFNFTFKIYDAYTGGNVLHQIINTTIKTDSNGVYDVILHNLSGLNFSDQYYLGIAVQGDNESKPRINLTSSPYSFRANISEDLNKENKYEVAVFNITGNLTVGQEFADVLTITTGRLNISDGNIISAGNLTIAEKITFGLGQIIDNLVSGFLRISGGLNVTGNVSIAQDTLFVDNTSGKVGIGTTTPDTKLKVAGDLNATGTVWAQGVNLSQSTSGGWTDDGSVIRLTTSTDSVGVGTSTPSEKFHVVGNGSYTGDLSLGGNIIGPGADGSGLDPLGWVDDGTIVRLATSTDKVGIGTSSPLQTLVVVGTVNITDSLNVSGTIEATTFIGDGSSLTGISTGQIWNSSGSNVFLNDSTASVGIGTVGPNDALEVIGNVRVSGSLNASSINATSIKVGTNDVQTVNAVFNKGNYSAEYSAEYATSGFDNENFTTRYDARANRFLIANYSAEYASTGYKLANFTSNLNTQNASLWNTSGSNIFQKELSNNVGIGKTSPNFKLDVAGQINASGMHIDGDLNVTGSTYFGTQSFTNIDASGNIVGKGNLTINNSVLFVDRDSGKIGIGTASPSAALDIGGGSGQLADGTEDLLIKGDLEVDDDVRIDGSAITTSVATTWDLVNSQTSALNIESGLLNLDTSNSRVGIGNTIPNNTLDVSGNANVSGILHASGVNVSGTVEATTFIGDGSSLTGLTTGHPWNSSGTNVYLNDSTAKVGIGTATPVETLSVTGNFSVTGNQSYGGSLTIGGDFISTGGLGSTDTVSSGWADDGTVVRLIDSTNRVGIGTSSPDLKFHMVNGKVRIEQSSDAPEILLTDNSDNDTFGLRFQRSSNAFMITGAAADRTPTNSKALMTILQAGNVGIGTTTPTESLVIMGNLSINDTTGGTSRLFVDVSTGNVGIGTSSPNDALEVVGNVRVSGSINATNLNTTGQTILASSSGNVGIGNTIPNSTLDVSGNANVSGILHASGVNVSGTVEATTFIGSGSSLTGLTNGHPWNSSGTTLYLNDSSAKVGIGTATPLQTLVVVGTVNITDSLNVSGTIEATTFIGSGASLTGISSTTPPWNSSGTNVYLNDSSARVGIGTASPISRLHVKGNVTINGTINITGGSIIQSPLNPTIKGSVQDATIIGEGADLYVSGKYAYIAVNDGDRLTIVDISNPSSPTITGSITDATQLDTAKSIHVSGKYAYVAATNADRLTIIDISNPYSPTIVSSLVDSTTLDGINGVYVSGKYAYVAAGLNHSLTIVDISDPSNPAIVGNVNNTQLRGAFSVYVSGKYAYVAAGLNDSLTIVDISNPSSPSIVGSIDDDTQLNGAKGLYVSGSYAYIGVEGSHRLTIVNVSNPSSPNVISSIQDTTLLAYVTNVYVSGKYAYLPVNGVSNERLTVVDISNPNSPLIVSSIEDGTQLDGALSVYVSGKYAYVTAGQGDRLTIVDISGIDAPAASIGNIEASDITVSDNLDVGNNLYVRTALNVGPGGILSDGSISISDGDFRVNGSILYVNSTSGVVSVGNNMGIGTSSPKHTLHVIGDANFTKNIFYGGNLTGYGADYAEMFESDFQLENADVVCLDEHKKIDKCTKRADPSVIGVVSTDPAIIGRNRFAHAYPVGLLGVVPTKVTGPVDIFSLLTTSNQEGYAEQATNADLGAMIGKAMEECYEDKCVIDVVVNLQ